MRHIKKILAIAMLAIMLNSNTSFTAPTVLANSISNNSVNVAKEIWSGEWKNEKTAIIVPQNEENIVDALSIAPLAYAKKAPILLVNKGDNVDEEVLKSLKNQNVDKIYLSSGVGILTNNMKKQLENEGIKVVRLGGKDRIETSENIAKELGDYNGVVIIGYNGASDAISIASIASRQKMAIAIANSNGDFSKTPIKTEGKDIYILGGETLVSKSVENKLNANRIFGEDRYETSIEIIKEFKNKIKFDKVFIASGLGKGLHEGLVSSLLAAQSNAPMFLVSNNNEYMKVISKFLKENVNKNTEIILTSNEKIDAIKETIKEVNKEIEKQKSQANKPSRNSDLSSNDGSSSNESNNNENNNNNNNNNNTVVELKGDYNIKDNQQLGSEKNKYVITGNLHIFGEEVVLNNVEVNGNINIYSEKGNIDLKGLKNSKNIIINNGKNLNLKFSNDSKSEEIIIDNENSNGKVSIEGVCNSKVNITKPVDLTIGADIKNLLIDYKKSPQDNIKAYKNSYKNIYSNNIGTVFLKSNSRIHNFEITSENVSIYTDYKEDVADLIGNMSILEDIKNNELKTIKDKVMINKNNIDELTTLINNVHAEKEERMSVHYRRGKYLLDIIETPQYNFKFNDKYKGYSNKSKISVCNNIRSYMSRNSFVTKKDVQDAINIAISKSILFEESSKLVGDFHSGIGEIVINSSELIDGKLDITERVFETTRPLNENTIIELDEVPPNRLEGNTDSREYLEIVDNKLYVKRINDTYSTLRLNVFLKITCYDENNKLQTGRTTVNIKLLPISKNSFIFAKPDEILSFGKVGEKSEFVFRYNFELESDLNVNQILITPVFSFVESHGDEKFEKVDLSDLDGIKIRVSDGINTLVYPFLNEYSEVRAGTDRLSNSTDIRSKIEIDANEFDLSKELTVTIMIDEISQSFNNVPIEIRSAVDLSANKNVESLHPTLFFVVDDMAEINISK